ncbi:hypothetical protein [Amycolatopsis sp. CA-230715]|uniref:hypothetical protein n=1 Tax=Amycolatopsis sp. CA-230715 TaxID=2745196 RepID=UPI001C321EB2|nr:hypothetical protein [Amycolatopsis sp. CA-230715]QWF77060.1 hypothetical protein HUW46_00440 [Amycolatopsis sp. CA-230715]
MDIQRFAVGLAVLAVLGAGTASSAASEHGPRPGKSPEPAAVVPPGRDFTLTVGQEAAIAGRDLAVRFTGLVSDSRCPPRMQCIWQGEAVARFVVRERAGSTTADLHTGARGGPRDARTVELVSVSQDGHQVTVRAG